MGPYLQLYFMQEGLKRDTPKEVQTVWGTEGMTNWTIYTLWFYM